MYYENDSYPIRLNINITESKVGTAALQTSEVEEILITVPCILKYRVSWVSWVSSKPNYTSSSPRI